MYSVFEELDPRVNPGDFEYNLRDGSNVLTMSKLNGHIVYQSLQSCDVLLHIICNVRSQR